MISYSQKTKETLALIQPSSNCCKRLSQDIKKLGQTSSISERIDVINNSSAHFKCQHCFGTFLRGLFLLNGSITDPHKQYHLELSFISKEEQIALKNIFLTNGLKMLETTRKNRYILYIKSSVDIEDFLGIVGANTTVFDLMNSKFEKELRGEINRQTNCDMANIKKSLESSKIYIEAINSLIQSGKIAALSEDLRETAELRVSHDEASLRELAVLHNPPISKPGVKHRLDKILDFYNSLK